MGSNFDIMGFERSLNGDFPLPAGPCRSAPALADFI